MQYQLPNRRKALMRVAILAISLAIISGTTPISLAGTEKAVSKSGGKNGNKDNPPQVVGQLTVYGSVTVNDKKAISGTTVFTDSRIKVACAKGNRAIVTLGALGRVELNPGTQYVIRYTDSLIGGDLIEGNILVNSSPGVKVSINSAEGVTATDGQEASVVPVRTQRGVRCVPMVMSSSSASPALNSAAIAAILLGAGGAAVAGAVVSTDTGSVVSPSN